VGWANEKLVSLYDSITSGDRQVNARFGTMSAS
jgi:hypothetical protein